MRPSPIRIASLPLGILLASLALSHAAKPSASHPRPNPARFAKDIARFDAEEKSNPPARGGIVFTGSSSVRLWKLEESFPGLPVLNRGFGGSVANDLLVYARQVVLRYRPAVLVIYTGSNDLNAKLSPEEAFSDYTRFLTLVHDELPATTVIVNSVKVAPVRATQMEAVANLNKLLETWCRERPWIRWVDATSYLLSSDGQPIARFYRKDRLHLSEEGYARWNAILDPVLRDAWARRPQPATAPPSRKAEPPRARP